MVRQPFRRTKSDGTIDDGTGGGGATKNDHYGASVNGISAFGTTKYRVPSRMMGIRTQTFNACTAMNYVSMIPMWSYQGGTIDYISMRASTANSNATMKIGVYDSKAAVGGAPYPDNLVAQTSITFTSTSPILAQLKNAAGNANQTYEMDEKTWYFIGLVWADSNTTNLYCKPASTLPHYFEDGQNDVYCSVLREIGSFGESANTLVTQTSTSTSNQSSVLNDITDQIGAIPWVNVRVINTFG
jgi:hypothetical protein